MKFTVVIIEDELPARVTLRSYLRKYFPDAEIIAELDSIQQSINYLSETIPDIIFLDVQLKDGLGIEILKNIEVENHRVIFTTAFDNYTLEAFKYKSFGYLLKPLDPTDFKTLVGRVLSTLKDRSNLLQERKIKVLIPGGHRWILLQNIVRCEAQSNYTKIVCDDGHVYMVSKTLKYVEDHLIRSESFFRVHQSHLINLQMLQSLVIRENKVTMSNHDLVPVSRSRKEAFRRMMEH